MAKSWQDLKDSHGQQFSDCSNLLYTQGHLEIPHYSWHHAVIDSAETIAYKCCVCT